VRKDSHGTAVTAFGSGVVPIVWSVGALIPGARTAESPGFLQAGGQGKRPEFIIRPTAANDIGPLQDVLDLTGLFPPELLPDMLQGFLAGETDAALWLTADIDDQPLASVSPSPKP